MKPERYKSEFKAGFKDGFTKSKTNATYRYIGYAVLASIIILCIIIIWPSNAVTIDDISQRGQIADRYGLNRLYTVSSSYPGAHTVYNAKIHIALFPGVNKTLIEESLKGINPFYQFDYIDYRTVRYYTNNKGMIYTLDKDVLIISVNDNPCSSCMCSVTHGTASIGVQIWIKAGDTPTVEWMNYLIEHELDHLYGLRCDHSNQDISENITANYTEETKMYGTVQINVMKGDSAVSWQVYI